MIDVGSLPKFLKGDTNSVGDLYDGSDVGNTRLALMEENARVMKMKPLEEQSRKENNEFTEDKMDTPVEAAKKKPVPAEKKPVPAKSTGWDANKELMDYGSKPMADKLNTLPSLVKQTAQAIGVDPAMLLSSSWVEGGNKQTIKGNMTSPLYDKAFPDGELFDSFPVDGFAAYGIDTIGDKWDQVKKFLPKDFKKRLKFYKNRSEPTKANPQGAIVTSAGFDSDQAALMAKAAMLKLEEARIDDYLKEKNAKIDPKDKPYFIMMAYNRGNAFKAIREYLNDKDKSTFISGGRTSFKEAHENTLKRWKSMETAKKLTDEAKDVIEE